MDMKTAQAVERLKNDPDFARRLLTSPDGQALMALLSRPGGSQAVENAANAAAQGSTRELTDMLRSLLKSPEGAALMRRLGESAKQ